MWRMKRRGKGGERDTSCHGSFDYCGRGMNVRAWGTCAIRSCVSTDGNPYGVLVANVGLYCAGV